MKVLITGANGFIGKNLITTLEQQTTHELLKTDIDTTSEDFEFYLKDCDFIFHLAGVNRPKNNKEFIVGNTDLTVSMLEVLKNNGCKTPIVFASSIQVDKDNPYGYSKRLAEDALVEYGKTGAPVYIYRLTNIFGKWSKPYYNTVVATFCYNIARDLPIEVNNPDAIINLCYIDDVIENFLKTLAGIATVKEGYCVVDVNYPITVGDLAKMITSFKQSRHSLSIPDMSNPLCKNLYSTYLSFLPIDAFSYPLKMNVDHRGSFTEFIRNPDRGQISVNISKPGITKGNHWHHSKNEKFLVVSGTGVIRFRQLGTEKVIEYYVSGDELEVVDVPPGYTHNIVNLGDTDMVTLIWVNESFISDKPDTYYEEV